MASRLILPSNGDTLVVENFINGNFKPCKDYIDSYDPSTGKPFALIPESSLEDVNDAVSAARDAFPKWSKTPVSARANILFKIANLIDENLDLLAIAESKDQGKPISLAKRMDIPRAALNFRAFAETISHHTNISNSLPEMGCLNFTKRSPVGVALLVSPWNLPLYLLTFKIAPAIATGNTVVCKPSEVTSVTAWMLCALLKEAGLPAGVVNMTFGTGPRCGELLINHKDINVISFTGSTGVGRHIAQIAAKNIKKVSLEMGGKNAAIIYEDADLSKAVASVINSCFLNQGEICLCTSRLFIQRSIFDEFLQSLVRETKKLKVGSSHDDYMGPLVSKIHMDKVKGYINKAREEGGKIHCGEHVDELCLPSENEKGYFVRPTIISNLLDSSPLMQEEIFGPVVCVTPFDTEEEVINRANNVKYGLCCSIWGENGDRLLRTAQSMDVGTVWINCWLIRSLDMPFGGMKESGIGREGTTHSLELFTEETTICYKFD